MAMFRFSDAFNFLISLPRGQHIWCSSWDLMGPLLETFYNYFKDESDCSPLKILWTRISNETRECTQCICQHHQAQETYHKEYEPTSIGPLLEVLRTLDEERVSRHLKEINARVTEGKYDPHHNAEVVCLMFEVLVVFFTSIVSFKIGAWPMTCVIPFEYLSSSITVIVDHSILNDEPVYR